MRTTPSTSFSHQHTCPDCGHTWDCLGVWTKQQKLHTPATCQRSKGLKTNGGTCDLCYHINMAKNIAAGRYPHMGDRALSEVLLQRHARRSATVQET
jgi:hypothetical protein